MMTESNLDHGSNPEDGRAISAWAGLPFPTSMHLLVVEADEALRRAIHAAVSSWTFRLRGDSLVPIASITKITEATSVCGAIRALRNPVDVVIVDTNLGGESGLGVVEHACLLDRAPAVLATSDQATAAVGFELAKFGARGCLAKPFVMDDLRAAIQTMLAEPPDLALSAKAQVGYRHIHVVQDQVKSAMLKRAFTLEAGNITRAARRLGVTRTAVQQMLDRYGLPRTLPPSEPASVSPSER